MSSLRVAGGGYTTHREYLARDSILSKQDGEIGYLVDRDYQQLLSRRAGSGEAESEK